MSPNYVLLEEQRVDASSADADHPIALAFDGGTNTYWSTSEPQATITVEIPGTAHLAALILHPGVRGQPDAFRTPSKLELVSLDTGASVTIDVRSGVDRQDHTFDMPVTGRLEMRIVSTHGDASLPLAISEIELNAAE